MHLKDPNIDAGTTGNYIGSLVGYLGVGTLTDCSVVGGSVFGGNKEVCFDDSFYGNKVSSLSSVSIDDNWFLVGEVMHELCYDSGVGVFCWLSFSINIEVSQTGCF